MPLPFSAFISVKLSFDGDVNFDGNMCSLEDFYVISPVKKARIEGSGLIS